MIFILLFVFLILLFICYNFISSKWLSRTLGIIFGILSLITICLMIGNFKYHLGMKQAESTTRTNFSSVNKNVNMILYQKIGKSNDQVVIYKKTADQNKPTVTKAIDTTNNIQQNANENKLLTKTKNWVYKNEFYRVMFGWATKKEFIHRTNTFKVKNGYIVLSTQQAKQFSKIMKEQEAKAKAEENNPEFREAVKAKETAFVKQTMMSFMEKDPMVSPAQAQKVEKQAKKDFKNQMINQAKAKLVENALQTVKDNK